MIAQGAWLSGLAVTLSSTVQLFSASCYCRRPYSQSNQFSWDTSFPTVILSLHNQQDDDIFTASLTLGSVWTAARTKHTHTHKCPTLDPLSSLLPLFRQLRVKQPSLLLVLQSGYIYLERAIPDCHEHAPGSLDSVWTQPVMRPSGVKLLRTLHDPSAMPMKILNRMEVGADLNLCQHAVKSSPHNCRVPLPCCGSGRAGD